MMYTLICAVLALFQETSAFSPPSSPRSKSFALHATQALPRMSQEHLNQLAEQKYTVIYNFIDNNLQESLRQDVLNLRQAGKFRQAKIGEGSTNQQNDNIRIAETCFIGPNKLSDVKSSDRNLLYDILDAVRNDLPASLDSRLTELLYAYYPQGGYYRRHSDATPGSTSSLRQVSLLLYLNDQWQESHGGNLRLHLDGGGDELPANTEPNFVDVSPLGGTLVLFDSAAIPHEVLDTNKERYAIVGWYNRPVDANDLAEAAIGISPTRLALLGVAATLVLVGVVQLIA